MKDDWRLTDKHAYQHMDFNTNDVFLYENFRSEYMGISDSGIMCVNLSKVYHKFEKMKEEIDRLKERSDILSKYDTDGSYSNLRKKYDELKKAYVGLADIPSKLDSLQKECNELRGKNASLEKLKDENEKLKYKINLLECKVKMRDSLLWPKDADELFKDTDEILESIRNKGSTTIKEEVSLTECLINEGVSKYKILRELISLVFSIAGVVMSWNHGLIYLLLFLPVLIVRLLPSEETIKMILMDYCNRKENEQNGKY